LVPAVKTTPSLAGLSWKNSLWYLASAEPSTRSGLPCLPVGSVRYQSLVSISSDGRSPLTGPVLVGSPGEIRESRTVAPVLVEVLLLVPLPLPEPDSWSDLSDAVAPAESSSSVSVLGLLSESELDEPPSSSALPPRSELSSSELSLSDASFLDLSFSELS
jgi:hypothetical protein